VEENGNDIDVTFYGTEGSTDLIQYVGRLGEAPGPPDTLVRDVTWAEVMTDRARYTIHLSRAPFGYLVLWTPGGFVLRVRRPPKIDPTAPLRGLTIAVDPGHPPAGSTGPTGLYEGVATLAIAQYLEAMLNARGATVIMTRTTEDAVALTSRPVIARRGNVDAMVSIHLNALPDGTNPFISHGTGSYYFHPQSLALARAVQVGMVATMGLRDLGVHYDNLAVVRPTWMPAVLCEGAFVIIPQQEAALRTAAFQARYAQGVADGLTAYFRGLAVGPPLGASSAAPASLPTPAPPAAATSAPPGR
jgi:N-acetylmuramoyl-L-alanine amidase